MNGYAGRILRVNLSDGTITTEPTPGSCPRNMYQLRLCLL